MINGLEMKLDKAKLRLYLFADTCFDDLFTTEDRYDMVRVKSRTRII